MEKKMKGRHSMTINAPTNQTSTPDCHLSRFSGIAFVHVSTATPLAFDLQSSLEHNQSTPVS
jgi:hypothetical protein